MPAEVVIYTTSWCPYCIRAKSLLSKKSVDYREINVEERPELRSWIQKRSGQRTVPQVFVNGQSLGGYSELSTLDQKGKLDELLARPRAAGDPSVEL